MSLRERTKNMKNWAVVGATDKKNRFGYKIYKKLKDKGYNVYAVNPNLEEIDDDKCYKKLEEIEGKIDVVDFVVNPKIGIHVIETVNKLGIEYVWLQPGTRSRAIRKYAENNDIKYVEGCIYAEL